METLGLAASTSQSATPTAPIRRWSLEWFCLCLGVVAYAVSFFLPAVFLPGSGENFLSGFECAIECIAMVLFLPCGLINPLAVAYLYCRWRNLVPRASRSLAIATLALVPLTWLVIAGFDMKARIGHVLWVAGLLLMLGPEALLGRRSARSSG